MSSPDGRKRDRPDDEFITRVDLESILNGLKEEVAAGVKLTTTSAVNDLEQKFTSAMANALRKTDANYQDRFGAVEGEIKELKMRMEQIEGWRPNTDRAVAEVRHAVALAESSANVQELLDVDDFDRQTDLTIVRARILDAVTPAAARAAVCGIMEEMNLKDDEMKIEGKDLDKGFTFRFAGCTATAARRARKFMQLQRDGGEWRDLVAKTPDGSETKMYLDVDKSKKQIKMEMMSRRLQGPQGEVPRSRLLQSEARWHRLDRVDTAGEDREREHRLLQDRVEHEAGGRARHRQGHGEREGGGLGPEQGWRGHLGVATPGCPSLAAVGLSCVS